MPEPTATWNPARGAWETSTANLLCGHWELYLATWPASGSMRSGTAFPPPRSAAPTSASGSSSSPALPTPRARDSKGIGYPDGLPSAVTLLPTPTVSEANGTGPADGPRNDTLRAQVALLPTPRASERENRQTKRSPSQEKGTHGKSLAAEVGELLLPTPRATDGSHGGPNQRGSKGDLTLPSAAALLLPTPRASDTGTPGRRASQGFSPPLSQVVLPLLPTPTAGDSKGSRQATAPNPRSPSPTLTDVVRRGDLTPPPSTAGNTSSDAPPPPPPTSAGASPRSSSSG